MISNRKKQANRKNATRSTGPRTAEGKWRSSHNALKHGLEAIQRILPDESAEEYAVFLEAFVSDLRPVGHAELFFARRAADLAWRLQRASRAEADLFRHEDEELRRRVNQEANRQRAEQRLADFIAGQSDEIVEQVEKIREAFTQSEAISLAPAFQVYYDKDPMTRLGAYETRLDRGLKRSLRELARLRELREWDPAEADAWSSAPDELPEAFTGAPISRNEPMVDGVYPSAVQPAERPADGLGVDPELAADRLGAEA